MNSFKPTAARNPPSLNISGSAKIGGPPRNGRNLASMRNPSKLERVESLLERGVDFSSRTLALHGEIDQRRASQFLANISIINETPGPITVQLFSEGGEFSAGLAIFDAIRGSINPVTVEGTGEVSSMAAVVLQAGHKRVLTPEARLMIHNVYISMQGQEKFTSHYLRNYSREIEALSARYQAILVERTKLSVRQVKAWCEKEHYLSAKDAVRFGFADEIKGIGHGK